MSKLAVFAKTLADLGNKRIRKNPRIHPKAKSKLFSVRQPTPVDPVEEELCRKWWTEYRLQYEAVSKLFKYEVYRRNVEIIETSRTDHEHDRNRRHELTANWNTETHLAATDKLEKLLDTLIDKQTSRLTDYLNKQSVCSEKLESNLATVAMLAEKMITEENLDEKVEEIMNSDTVDYNFVVDYKGNIIRGSESLQHKPPPDIDVEESVQNDVLSVTS
ncbi:unnamed protein product [Heterobilharzia americana]|nr:unnamed protein product [Heterobilharzia americana]CAH8561814.1 unnamed protein product [Heterobilharzia americana]